MVSLLLLRESWVGGEVELSWHRPRLRSESGSAYGVHEGASFAVDVKASILSAHALIVNVYCLLARALFYQNATLACKVL